MFPPAFHKETTNTDLTALTWKRKLGLSGMKMRRRAAERQGNVQSMMKTRQLWMWRVPR